MFDRREEKGEIHVVPVYDNGITMKPHILHIECLCHPTVEYGEDYSHPVVIHNELH